MKTTITIFLFLTCLLSVLPLEAQTVDDPNALVFYFDEAATQRSWYGTGEVTVYLIAGPMRNGENIFHFLNSWGAWELVVMPMENVTGATLTMRGNASPEVVEIGPEGLDIEVVLLEPLPLDGRTVLAELDLDVVSTAPTELWAWGGDCVVDDIPWQFALLTSGSDGPMDMTGNTANINAGPPVATTARSWGQVKALYR